MILEIPTIDLWQYLLQQVPVVVVLGIVCIALYKIIKVRDKVIREKDIELANERKQVMDLYGQAIAAQAKTTESLNRSNDIKVQLMALIKDLQTDVDKLRETIHDKI